MKTIKMLWYDFKEEWKENENFRIILLTLFSVYVILLGIQYKVGEGHIMTADEIMISTVVNLTITIIGAVISYKLAIKKSNRDMKESLLKQRSLDNWNRELDKLERIKTEWKDILLLVDNICYQAAEFCTSIKTSVKSIIVNENHLDAIDYGKITKDLHDLNFKLMDFRQIISHSDYDNSENKNKLYDYYHNVLDTSVDYYDNYINYCESVRNGKEAQFNVAIELDNEILDNTMRLLTRILNDINKKIDDLKSQEPR